MTKITHTDIEKIYKIAKRVYHDDNFSLSEGKEEAASATNMAVSSAQDYINNFRHMMEGTRFTRTNKIYAVEYYLLNIYKEYGASRLENALEALKKHFLYYESIRQVNRGGERKLYNKYKLLLSCGKDEYEQQLATEYIRTKQKSRKELLDSLNQKAFDKKVITVNDQKIQRDNYAISIIKELRGYKCQFCGITIKKSNDLFYIEAAHISPSCDGGKETPDNIILLCPNHHKELDLGNSYVKKIDDNKVLLSLNGFEKEIDLHIPD